MKKLLLLLMVGLPLLSFDKENKEQASKRTIELVYNIKNNDWRYGLNSPLKKKYRINNPDICDEKIFLEAIKNSNPSLYNRNRISKNEESILLNKVSLIQSEFDPQLQYESDFYYNPKNNGRNIAQVARPFITDVERQPIIKIISQYKIIGFNELLSEEKKEYKYLSKKYKDFQVSPCTMCTLYPEGYLRCTTLISTSAALTLLKGEVKAQKKKVQKKSQQEGVSSEQK